MPRNRGSRGKKDGAGRFIEVAACYGGFRLPAARGGGRVLHAQLELQSRGKPADRRRREVLAID